MRATVVATSVVCRLEKHEMARLASRHRNAHRLRIAHLADDDDVWRLAEGGAKRGGEVRRVDADFDLLDQALAVRVLVLDRILDRDDVPRVALVDLVHQRRQRRRLAGAGRPADEHEPARQPRDGLDGRRQVERREGAAPTAGRRRMAAAGRPRSWCRLMRNRPSSATRYEESATPSSR